MKRLIAALLALAVAVPACGADPVAIKSAGLTGTYAICTLTITFNADGTVVFQQIAPILVLISGPGPGPIPPGPVSDLRAKLAAAVAAVTASDRVATASTLNQALTATVAAARAGTVTQSQVSLVLSMLGPTMPAWNTFIGVLNDAVKTSTTPAGLGDVLQIAVDELARVK